MRGHMHCGTDRLVTAKKLAEILGDVGQSTIYRMAQNGQIPSYLVGRSGVRFDVGEVRTALRRQVGSSRSD